MRGGTECAPLIARMDKGYHVPRGGGTGAEAESHEALLRGWRTSRPPCATCRRCELPAKDLDFAASASLPPVGSAWMNLHACVLIIALAYCKERPIRYTCIHRGKEDVL